MQEDIALMLSDFPRTFEMQEKANVSYSHVHFSNL